MEQQQLTYLLTKYREGTASASEVEELAGYIAENEQSDLFNATLADLIGQHEEETSAQELLPYEGIARYAHQVDHVALPASAPTVHRIHFLKTAWFRYAAALIILMGTGAYMWSRWAATPSAVAVTRPATSHEEILPGQEGAVLTLADGTQVVLDSLRNGTVAHQNGAQIIIKDGQLAYDPTAGLSGEVGYNTTSTPKARQFKITLPDGTRVWLNSASSIRYPTVFTGKERKVDIKGEAYLEVSKDNNRPFVVNVNNQSQIQVLGTSFNVNAYDDETFIKATLIEGSVRVNANEQSQILEPGQQARVSGAEKIRILNNTDLNQVLAWKNGLFNFDGYDVKSVMREISRWYDIEVVYESEPGRREIGGKMQRNLTLSQAMDVLKDLNIHCRLEGRKLIVQQ